MSESWKIELVGIPSDAFVDICLEKREIRIVFSSCVERRTHPSPVHVRDPSFSEYLSEKDREDFTTSRCSECGLDNITSRHECNLTRIEAVVEAKKRNRAEE